MNLDLYLIELDVNNDPCVNKGGPFGAGIVSLLACIFFRRVFETMPQDDTLMRSLLQLPQQPAVVRIR